MRAPWVAVLCVLWGGVALAQPAVRPTPLLHSDLQSGKKTKIDAAKDDPAALSDLSVLKVRSVVETLIQLLGSDADVQPVVANLQKVLPITDDARPTPPTAQDVDVLIDATGAILNLAK